MSATISNGRKTGWFSGLIDGAARALAFGRATAPASVAPARGERSGRDGKSARKIDMKGVTLQVQRLAANGHARAEIARRTALSQDTVAFLLQVAPATADETAGRGTFFRIRPRAVTGPQAGGEIRK